MRTRGGRVGRHGPMSTYVPSPDEVTAAQTPKGGWTKRQLAEWGVPWPPPQGWRKHLEAKWRGEDVPPLENPETPEIPDQDTLF
ncbi:hypothetical protein HUT19_20840 [Streptomyces sp. NA02950]|nr:hypothetical protein HUT19_20840 [Streptomyces sp. NA02950]